MKEPNVHSLECVGGYCSFTQLILGICKNYSRVVSISLSRDITWRFIIITRPDIDGIYS